MKADLTEILFILDRSGSMQGLETDTIGGYNAFLDAQRKEAGQARVTTVLFDDKYEVLHQGADIQAVGDITGKEYFARGTTALMDAVGKSILDADLRLSALPEEERPARVIVVITTDGLENASRVFSRAAVCGMIAGHSDKLGWEFIFLGANIDAEAAAEGMGIRRDRAANYRADAQGTASLFIEMSENVSEYRSKGRIKEDWKKPFEQGQ